MSVLWSLASSLQNPNPMALPIACVDMATRHPIFPLHYTSAAFFPSHSIQSQYPISYTRNIGLHRKLSSSCSATPHFWGRELGIWDVGTAVAVEAEAKVEAVPVPDTAESRLISILLFSAFIGLTVLSVGVTYLAVKDFQEKRERDKLLKEEQALEKENDSKREKLKPGPRGFGQKLRPRGSGQKSKSRRR